MGNNERPRKEANEINMLRWMCGVLKKDNIRNYHARGSVKLAPVAKKTVQRKG